MCNHNVPVMEMFALVRLKYSILFPSDFYLFIVIIAMQSRDTPTFPYCINGIIWHSGPSGSHVPWMKRYALNGRTITQNKQSAMHKL